MTLNISYIVYIKPNGEINNFSSYRPQIAPPEGETEDGFTVKYMTLEDVTSKSKDTSTFCEEYWMKGGQWVKRPPRKNLLYMWNYSTESWELHNQGLIEEIRMERNAKLYSSDWTQAVSDHNLTEEEVIAWRVYRQELRDFMSSIDSNIEGREGLVWPISPTGDR